MTALQALSSAFAKIPENLEHDAVMIASFAVIGIGFCLLFEPERRGSLGGALGFVFRREFFQSRTARVDLLHFFLSLGLWMPVAGALLAALLSVDVRAVLAGQFGARAAVLHTAWLIAAIQFVVIFAARDLGSYAGHALMHKVPLLWSVHRSHHSAETLTFLTSVRAHPLETLHMQFFTTLFGGLGGGILLYLTGTSLQGLPVAMLVAVGLFFDSFGLAQHSHLPISFGRLNYILVAPVMHQLHHSAEPRHRDRNLGAQLAIFDWLFGTLYIPQGREEYRLGLNEQERGAHNPHLRLRDFYLEPVRHAWGVLTRQRAGPRVSASSSRPS